MESGRVASLGRTMRHALRPARMGACRVSLFLLEGKRELESLISDGNAEHQLLRILAAFEPDGSGSFIAWFDGCRFQGQGEDLLRRIDEGLFALFAHGVFFSVLVLNDVVRRGHRRRQRRFVADAGSADWFRGRNRSRGAGWFRYRFRPQYLVGHALGQLGGILIEERSAVRANLVQDKFGGLNADGLGAFVSDGDIGAQLPSGIVERHLHGKTVGCERFDKNAIAHEMVASRCVFMPTYHAVLAIYDSNGRGALGRGNFLQIYCGHESDGSVGSLDSGRVAFIIREQGYLFTALQCVDKLQRK